MASDTGHDVLQSGENSSEATDQQLMATLTDVSELASTGKVAGYIAPQFYNQRFMSDYGVVSVGQYTVTIIGDHPDANRDLALYSSGPVELGRFVRTIAIEDGPDSNTTTWYAVDPSVSEDNAFVAVTDRSATKASDSECRISTIPAQSVHALAELLYARRQECERERYSSAKPSVTEQAPQVIAQVTEAVTSTAERIGAAGKQLIGLVTRGEQSA